MVQMKMEGSLVENSLLHHETYCFALLRLMGTANEWIKKLWYIYTVEFYAAERKELIPFVIAWMELESIMLSEINQAVRDKCHMISPLTGT